MKKSNKHYWIIWLGLFVILTGIFTYTLLNSNDKTVFMPGKLTGGHHQIGVACDSCHGESFADKDTMQKLCVSCHGEQRKKPFDSHPREKFTDPRNADRLENINALYCITCHVEHKTELADKNGVTQPSDFCIHCHQDIAKDRPSHKGMEFDTCASAGCHNYHNNRSLYTDFLIKHQDEPDLLEKRVVPEKEFAKVLDEVSSYPHDRYPVKKLSLKDIDAPLKAQFNTTDKIRHNWLMSSHAQAGANCTSCHIQRKTGSNNSSSETWVDKPDHTACMQCHDVEVKHFLQGKHGMRLQQELSPMTPSMARLPMKSDAIKKQLNCNSCHQSHQYELETASVDACLSCHNDKHSLAYKKSSHYQLWLKEQSGELPKGSGVTCASCHMPRVSIDVNDWLRRTVVQHNQNATLSPNEKMIRPACMNCHGLEFSIDALADKILIDNNFSSKPSIHVESMDLAKQDNLRHLEKEFKNSGDDTH